MGSIPNRVSDHKPDHGKTRAAMTRPQNDHPASWIEVRLEADPAAEDVLVWRLTELSGRGVAVDDSRPDRVVLTVWFDPAMWAEAEADLEHFLKKLSSEFYGPSLVMPAFTARQIAECDWTLAWRKFFRPIRPAPNLVVRPPWETADLKEGETEVIIDPGQAFGTGHHQSTALCLRLLARVVSPGRGEMLDVGCGSGILALAGLKLGAPRAVGLDVDPLAARVSQRNAAINHVGDRLALIVGGPQCVSGRWPLVAANLTAGDLVDLAGELTRLTAPGGWLIASGLLDEQAAEVQDQYGPPAWSEVVRAGHDGWTALGLRRGERT
jgi:ribosomal protein L11 methyltransferase